MAIRETKYLEFKEAITNTFLKSVSAFANYATGEIQFGIRDDGTICGIPHPEQACLDIENRINDSISPKPEYALSVDEDTSVITLKVFVGNLKPYLYKGKAYRRSDTASIEVDLIELKRLILDGEHHYFDELPCGAEELSFRLLESEFESEFGIEHLSLDMLKTLGLLDSGNRFNNAAALLADENQMPGVDIVRFGDSINDILDRERIGNVSILAQLRRAITIYQRYYQYERIEETKRQRIERIPEVAYREAIANALIHRTWDTNAYIRISMYHDRIEIVSPGGLPSKMTQDEYLKGYISSLRNPILANIFFRLHYIEMFGTGVRRIIESYRTSSRQPVFEISENAVCIVLPIFNRASEMTPEQKRIFELIKAMGAVSAKDISAKLGIKRDKTVRLLKIMVENQYVSVSGKARATLYSVRV